jgi:GDP/UDP-N,N'-diacetylbacillosamine 2-epimerase (hydrolysing)
LRDRSHAKAFPSLGQQRYLSCMQFVDGVVGNSSSGLTEAPSMAIGTVNIGDRQKGRLMAESVISCDADRKSISEALDRLFDSHFRSLLPAVRNPYGDGGASQKIVEILKKQALNGILKKTFHDLPLANEKRYNDVRIS